MKKRTAVLLAAAVALLAALGFGVRALVGRGSAPAPEASVQTARQLDPVPLPRGAVDPETVRLNRFLTGIVQQDVVDTRTGLDEDAELVRFVFGYRRTNAPDSVAVLDEGGVSCRALTLEQVNETLSELFGKTVSPDREDYGIPAEDFVCVFRGGRFLHMPPYPDEKYSFPLRFALVDKADAETGIVHFRLYRVNPAFWGEGEAERHIGVLPLLNFIDAESSENILNIGEGEARLLDSGSGLQLEYLTAELRS